MFVDDHNLMGGGQDNTITVRSHKFRENNYREECERK